MSKKRKQLYRFLSRALFVLSLIASCLFLFLYWQTADNHDTLQGLIIALVISIVVWIVSIPLLYITATTKEERILNAHAECEITQRTAD